MLRARVVNLEYYSVIFTIIDGVPPHVACELGDLEFRNSFTIADKIMQRNLIRISFRFVADAGPMRSFGRKHTGLRRVNRIDSSRFITYDWAVTIENAKTEEIFASRFDQVYAIVLLQFYLRREEEKKLYNQHVSHE